MEYESVPKLKRPQIADRVDSGRQECSKWMKGLIEIEGDITPGVFKKLVKPLGLLQTEVEEIEAEEEKNEKQYDSLNFDQEFLKNRVHGLFQGLFRSLGTKGKKAEGEWLFLPQHNSSFLHLFSTLDKSFKKIEVSFTFP